mgnify:FL=1
MFEELILNIVRANPGSKTVDIRKKFLALHPDHDWKEKSFRDMGTNGLIVDVRSVQIYTAWYIPTDVDLKSLKGIRTTPCKKADPHPTQAEAKKGKAEKPKEDDPDRLWLAIPTKRGPPPSANLVLNHAPPAREDATAFELCKSRVGSSLLDFSRPKSQCVGGLADKRPLSN